MKKRFSTLTVLIIGFLMMATGVYANDLYREWAGSDNFRQTEENLEDIQVGITTLQGNLEAVESELSATKTQLKDAEADSNTKQETIDDLNSKVTALEKEKTDTIALIKSELQDGITEVNGEKGPRHKYDKVKEIVNEWADKLGLASTSRLGDHGTSTEYEEKVEELTESKSDLEQAEKDMESLKNQSEEVLESLNTGTESTE